MQAFFAYLGLQCLASSAKWTAKWLKAPKQEHVLNNQDPTGQVAQLPNTACKSLSKVEFTPKLMKFSVYSSLLKLLHAAASLYYGR